MLSGLVLRAWAAGHVRKDEVLSTTGPFAHLRNPLFAGSFLVGVGIAGSGGHWIWPGLFVAYYLAVYVPAVREETALLTRMFGDAYRDYAAHVRAWVPRLRPYRAPGGTDPLSPSFSWGRYRRNREWEALLGGMGALALLAWKAWVGS